MFQSRDIQVFLFLNFPWFIKYVTSWWVLVQEAGYIFPNIQFTYESSRESIAFLDLDVALCNGRLGV